MVLLQERAVECGRTQKKRGKDEPRVSEFDDDA